MLKKKEFYIIGIVIGICLIGIGILLRGEELKAISGVALGIGAGTFGSCLANLIMKRKEEKKPDIKKLNEIEYMDERNTAIRNRAKAKSVDIIQWFIMGIAYLTILIATPIWVTAATVGVYLLHHILTLLLIGKYQKEM
ncbi:MAG: hypothetical protein ACYDEX_15805 [Mobilitalea sp.]